MGRKGETLFAPFLFFWQRNNKAVVVVKNRLVLPVLILLVGTGLAGGAGCAGGCGDSTSDSAMAPAPAPTPSFNPKHAAPRALGRFYADAGVVDDAGTP